MRRNHELCYNEGKEIGFVPVIAQEGGKPVYGKCPGESPHPRVTSRECRRCKHYEYYLNDILKGDNSL